MTKPIALDLCCRKGGATKGLQRAGFYVIGGDIEDQPGYPGDEFLMEDGLKTLDGLTVRGEIFTQTLGWVRPSLIWAGPPCQGQNTATASNRARGITDGHPSLVVPFREALVRVGIPYVIEQPTSSVKGTIRRDLTLCMDTFKGALPPPWVQKHRSFELSGFTVPQPKHVPHAGRVRGWRHGERFEGPYVAGYGKGGGKATAEELRHAMGIDWMTERFDLCEAIPPAYAEYIGRAFLTM
jgi:hypothetical protein